ncbi:hypothetical protein B7494_g5471 [Chlorociboria aeruginascens]|nr:hypothetical protein B7494_g5471 [Chlorociboria aeruginascens]
MLFFAYTLFILLAQAAARVVERHTLSPATVCQDIQRNIVGTVYYATDLSANFVSDNEHYMTSSEETPACVVEVASAEDVSAVLQIVGTTRTPFGVKSGGHASNPGFSSTTGVFISLVRLDEVTLSADRSTVEIGLGNVWTDVYSDLDGSGVNVVGGRVTGPGTGGFTLGGGYSWLTQQYGLTCDTTISYNLVLPNGSITTVDETQPDLFFALKGGLNRFGIVTSIVYKTVPQGQVYGGLQIFDALQIPDLIAATETYQQTNTDPKAQLIFTLNGAVTELVAPVILILFYDGPTRPSAFDPYNGIIPTISTLQTQSFASFSTSTPSTATAGNRGAFHTLMTSSLTTGFMAAVANESTYWGTFTGLHPAFFLSYDIEPFAPYGQYSTDSAFPHANNPLPLNLYFSWELEEDDAFWRAAIQTSVDTLTQVAIDEGIYSEDMYAYPNYALDTYTGDQVYGPVNAARLRSIQTEYDPDSVMLLAGGFTI